MTWLATLEAHAAAHPTAPCLLGPEGADWGTFVARVRALASAFAADRGRVVALALPDGPRAAEHLVACLVSGAIAFPLPPSATAHERERLLEGLDVARVVETPLEPGVLAAWQVPAEDEISLLVGTSGSTGRPKRVALRHGGLAWNAMAHAEAVGLPDGVRTLIVSPLYHAFPLVALLLGTLLKGGAVGFLGGAFTPRGLLKAIAAEAIGYVALTPTTLRLMRERLAEAALPPVISVGAAPMAADELVAAEAWARANGAKLYHTYGLSEAGPRVATLGPDDLAARPASVGRLLPGVEATIVEGELWLKTPSRMAGYYPEMEGVEADGWLRTGDRATIDAEGFLTLTGRLKDIIVTGGINVSLREIEEALLLDVRVAQAAVVAVPHAVYGEVPRAVLVATEPLGRQEVLTHLVGVLSRYKLPHEILFVPDLPRTALGKVDKSKLKELSCQDL